MPATITVGTNSWVTEAEANAYMAGHMGASDYWTDSAANNVPALITAYNELLRSGRWDLGASLTASQVVKDAQCEHALFLLIHEPDRGIREGLQAQLVVEAGVVKERYAPTRHRLSTSPQVENLLRSVLNVTPFHIFDVERDEEQETDYNAPGNLDRST